MSQDKERKRVDLTGRKIVPYREHSLLRPCIDCLLLYKHDALVITTQVCSLMHPECSKICQKSIEIFLPTPSFAQSSLLILYIYFILLL